LKTPRIIEAFRAVDRRDFVPDEYAGRAYDNQPLPIGYGQTISQPLTVAFMLELLDPQPGETIMEIGSGSGWQAALLGHLVGGSGKIYTVDIIPELCRFAEFNIGKYRFLSMGAVQVILGDGSLGAPPKYIPAKGFDRIIAAASAERKIPEVWKRQVKIGGRIVAPAGDSIFALTKITGREFTATEHPGFVFVPLVENNGLNH
jgi:protein-L-isoaspartate(D-aspartate) O-methyltransferase